MSVQSAEREGTSRVKGSKRSKPVRVSADGRGVVSHAGVGMLQELAEDTGLIAGVNEALAALRYGTISINCWTGVGYLSPTAPWGGSTGIGSTTSRAASA
ncbi:hypothetical protein [Saccharopolyspora sp. ASAGF58]|uniref:hypothetical protein n=1 Tax=Saccharopolyspora sp. ASAGF58 TaxID=2719023 RepID=UPI00143FFE57|nr:hypothetical protein [Saccharopolyspora sp. ASAGF58]QIZ36878.1 hypothetical protein FDZ84_22280 [Saccharopolyspora sp. ASAGF58]